MSMYSRWYDCYLLIGDYQLPYLWNSSLWEEGFEFIDNAIQLSRDSSTSIDSEQYSNENKKIKIGNIGWSKKNLNKLFSTEMPAEDLFGYTYIRSPKKSIVEKEDIGFDIYIEAYNLNFGTNQLSKYGEFALLCVAEDHKNKDEIQSFYHTYIDFVLSKKPGVSCFYTKRPWGKRPKVNIHHDIANFSYELSNSLREHKKLSIEYIPGEWQSYGS